VVKYKEPPLGLKPRDIWTEFVIGKGVEPNNIQIAKRYVEVRNAIERYINVDLEISLEWIEEYNYLHKIFKKESLND